MNPPRRRAAEVEPETGAVDAAGWALAATAALVVVTFHPGLADVFGVAKVTVAWFGVLATAGLLILAVVRSKTERFGATVIPVPWAVPVAAFLAVTGLAALVSDSRVPSAIGLYTRYGGWTSYLLYAATGLLAAAVLRRPAASLRLAGALVAAGVVAAVYAILQRLGIDAFEFREASGAVPRYPGSTLGNSAFAGAFLGITAPLLWVLGRTADQRAQIALGGAGAAYAVALWVTQSRSGMLAALGGGIVLAWTVAGRRQRIRRAVVAVTALAAVGMAAAVVLPEKPPRPLARVEVLRTESLRIRQEEWAVAGRIWADNKMLGTGPETYHVHYPRYRSTEDATRFGLLVTDKPHNLYLEFLSSTGVLGLLAFLAVIVSAVRLGIRGLRGPADGPVRPLLLAWLAVTAGYLAQAAFSFDVPPLALTGWAALGSVVALARPVADAPLATRAARTSRRRPAAGARHRLAEQVAGVALGVAAVVLLVIGSRPLRADLSASAAADAAGDGDRSQALVETHLARAIDLHPWEAAYRQEAGRHQLAWASGTQDRPSESALHVDESVRHHRDAARLQPGNVVHVVELAEALGMQGRHAGRDAFEEADRWWSEALRLDPNDWQVHNRRALMLNAWSNAAGGDRALRRRAADGFRDVVDLNPGHAPAWLNLARMELALGSVAEAASAAAEALRLDPGNRAARAFVAEMAGGPPPG